MIIKLFQNFLNGAKQNKPLGSDQWLNPYQQGTIGYTVIENWVEIYGCSDIPPIAVIQITKDVLKYCRPDLSFAQRLDLAWKIYQHLGEPYSLDMWYTIHHAIDLGLLDNKYEPIKD